jgi:Leucine-rich repeat (LRR) protein
VLRVGHSRVEDEGFENLASLTKLEELDFGGNKMSGRALPLLKMLPSLTRVVIGGLQRTDSGLWGVDLTDFNLDRIAELTDLTDLDLHDAKIGDRGLARLEGLTKLSRLDLSGSDVGANGAPSLAKFEGLRYLRLWNCGGVSDSIAATVRQLPNLETLDLAKTSLTDAGLSQLAGMPSLRKLYIGGTKVTPEAVAAFHQAHPRVELSWTAPEMK